jgi:predicted phosphoribosyltransferase
MESDRFKNRSHAGQLLARALMQFAHRQDVVVLALPRGGVPVGFEIAEALDVPLDIMVVRKLGVPWFEELAMGAVARGGMVVSQEIVQKFRITEQVLEQTAERERKEVERREQLYRAGRIPLDLRDHTVILVDDGLATGASMKAALDATRRAHPAQIVIAVPVGAADTCRNFAALADDVICLLTPESFRAVGMWYEDFTQTDDQEVMQLLAQSRHPRPAPQPVSPSPMGRDGQTGRPDA